MNPRSTALLLFVLLLLTTAVLADEFGAVPDLSWHSVDGGGRISTGGTLTLAGVIGQPDAGTLSGGTFELQGGLLSAFESIIVAPCPADTDGDLLVGIADFLAVLGNWGICPTPPESCPEDVDTDGMVGVNDFLTVLADWGPCL